MTLPAGFQEVTPSNLPRNFIHSLAEEIGKKINYNPHHHSELSNIVEKRLGGRVVQKNFWLCDDYGSIQIRSEGDFTIYLPDDATPERDRFTIAHELGHYILHYIWPIKKHSVTPVPACASRYGSDKAEWEANWFAAAFLMPKQLFSDAWTSAQDPLIEVSSAFGVSRRAAEIRARALGL